LLAVGGAVVLTLCGVALVIYTGSLLLGWILVPGGMLAVENMDADDWARVWLWGGAIGNVTLWTLVLYIALDLVASRHRRGGPVA
jgi:hypothetical protein